MTAQPRHRVEASLITFGMLLCLAEQGRIRNVELHKEAAKGDKAPHQSDQHQKAGFSFYACGHQSNIKRRTRCKL